MSLPLRHKVPRGTKKASVLNQHHQSICITQSTALRSATGPLQYITDARRGFCLSPQQDHKSGSLASHQCRSQPVFISD